MSGAASGHKVIGRLTFVLCEGLDRFRADHKNIDESSTARRARVPAVRVNRRTAD